MNYIKSYPLSILTTIVVMALSLLPIGQVEIAENVPLADKWTHMVMYAGLTAVICWERMIKESKGKSQKARANGQEPQVEGQETEDKRECSTSISQFSILKFLISPLIYAIALGGLMEVMQAYCTSYRSGEWLDFGADTIGALIGILIGYLFLLAMRRKK